MELTQKSRGGGGLPGMIATRKGTVLVAAVCALAATGIIVYAFAQYRKGVDNGNRPETVFVASSLIQKGTSGSAIAAGQFFKPTTIVAKQVSTGAIADAAALNGKVASANIYPGQQLTLSDFSSASGIAATLPPTMRAVEVPVTAASGLSGDVSTGDYVDIYVGFAGQSGGRATPLLRLLATNIQILKAPSGAGGLGASVSQGGNITLAVDENLAPQVMFASDNGKLWLALRPGNATSPNSRQLTTLDSILLAGAPVSSPGSKP